MDGHNIIPTKRSAPDNSSDEINDDNSSCGEDELEDELEPREKKQKTEKTKKKKTGGSGRRKIEIKFIDNKSRRQVTFSRRKRGLMKKAYELTTLTGTQALVLIASETGHVYTFATPKLQPVVTLREGKELIRSCLNAPDNNYPSTDYMPQAPQHSHTPPQQSHPHSIPKNEGGAPPPLVAPTSSSVSHHPHHDPNTGHLISPMYSQSASLPGLHQSGLPHGHYGGPPPMSAYPQHVDHNSLGYMSGPSPHHPHAPLNHQLPGMPQGSQGGSGSHVSPTSHHIIGGPHGGPQQQNNSGNQMSNGNPHHHHHQHQDHINDNENNRHNM